MLSGCLLLFGCNTNKTIEHDIVSSGMRPPAYPLITIDPYTSAWSTTDNLYDSNVKHWTGKDFPLIGVAKVDGELYRFMGIEDVQYEPIAVTGEQGTWTGAYTTQKPADNWMKPDFDHTKWQAGAAAFGTTVNEPTAKTNWDTEFIWVRRTIKLDKDFSSKNVFLEYSHDDDVIIYVDGQEVVNSGNTCKKNAILQLPETLTKEFTAGKTVTIAAFCHNRVGNGLLDFGLQTEKDTKKYFEKTAVQKSADVQATQTHYVFACGNVDLRLTFTAPLFTDDLDLLSRPVNYITYDIVSNDGKKHDIELYFEASPLWAVDKPHQETQSEIGNSDNLVFLKTGTKSQNILAKSGDDVRIDWGYFYMVADEKNSLVNIGENSALRDKFVNNKFGEKTQSTKVYDYLALVRKLGKVGSESGKIMLGYDDIYSIQYFNENLRPYWNRKNDQTIVSQFVKANKEYDSLIDKAYKFDKELMETASVSGGKDYAELCALAYRQAIAAHKLVEAPNGDLLFLSKENFSNGSIGTVDITYPSAPMFLLYNVDLVKGLMNHILYYSESGKWTKPFAAHDVGTYPLANGQTYGGDMPVEESGNMLILTRAIAEVEGNAEYAKKHWKVLTVWADYLVENGLDPENQLCTDDFAGHFAHNANLSVKAILGIASYGELAKMLGDNATGEKYITAAKQMAGEWEKMANDGDHYKLTFDKTGTWSQKYNLVWDKILKMGIFDSKIASTEIAYYLTKQNKYGLPLDNRELYTKTDWIIWTATLADDKATFEKFIAPIHLFMNETKDRVPMSDWVFTDAPNQRGFQARSVVGGYFIKMLDDKYNKK